MSVTVNAYAWISRLAPRRDKARVSGKMLAHQPYLTLKERMTMRYTNIQQLERVLSGIVKDIAAKYDIEPELVCAVIEDYSKLIGRQTKNLIIVSEN